MTSLTKILHPQAKNFFQVQTRRLALSFEPFTGSVVLTGQEKFPRIAACDPVVLAQEFPILAGRESVHDNVFVSTGTADVCFVVHFVCLFVKTHLLALLQDNCLALVYCAL